MPLLRDLRTLLRRRRQVVVDLSENGPHRRESGEDDVPGADDGPATSLQRSSRTRSVGDMQRSYDEVMGLVRKIGDHLDTQADRTQRLIDLMDRMPQALDALPEINRQNARLFEVLTDHLEHAKHRETALNTAIDRITVSSSEQTQVLGLIQQQLDANNMAANQMAENLGGFSQALGNLADLNSKSISVLQTLTRSSEEREARLAELLGRSQRWMIIVLCGCGLASVAAVVVAVLVLINQ